MKLLGKRKKKFQKPRETLYKYGLKYYPMKLMKFNLIRYV